VERSGRTGAVRVEVAVPVPLDAVGSPARVGATVALEGA